MDSADEKWIRTILEEIQGDIKELKNFREKDANNFRARLNLLEKQLAVQETQIKTQASLWGAATGTIFGIIAEIIFKNYL